MQDLICPLVEKCHNKSFTKDFMSFSRINDCGQGNEYPLWGGHASIKGIFVMKPRISFLVC